MSLGSVLSVARNALIAHQVVIQTAGNNIANVETEGYSRQRVELVPQPGQHWTYGTVGMGATVRDVTRARDVLLDGAYRDEASSAAGSRLRHDLLSSVESILGEPSDTGLAAAMDAFWSSWSDLATQPTSSAARSVVQQRGQNVASMLNGFDARLTDLRKQAAIGLDDTAGQINSLADEIAGLNGRIVSVEVDGTTAPDLRDQRDRAIDALSKLGAVRVIENADGAAQVMIGSNTLVDGVNARHVAAMTTPSGQYALRLTTGSEPMLPIGGTAQAALDFLNKDLSDTQGRLDAIAASLVKGVNDLHTKGTVYPATGAPTSAGVFFDPASTTAGTIKLDASIAASASNIAAAATVPTPPNVAGAGNNEIALQLAGLRTAVGQVSYVNQNGVTETDTFGNFYRDATSRVGTQVTNADGDAQVHETLASQADTRRVSVSGVNLDEELTSLMKAQQAYAAAAKIVQTASEMMDTLIQMV